MMKKKMLRNKRHANEMIKDLIDFGVFFQKSRIIDPNLPSNQVDLHFKAATSANPNIVPN